MKISVNIFILNVTIYIPIETNIKHFWICSKNQIGIFQFHVTRQIIMYWCSVCMPNGISLYTWTLFFWQKWEWFKDDIRAFTNKNNSRLTLYFVKQSMLYLIHCCLGRMLKKHYQSLTVNDINPLSIPVTDTGVYKTDCHAPKLYEEKYSQILL